MELVKRHTSKQTLFVTKVSQLHIEYSYKLEPENEHIYSDTKEIKYGPEFSLFFAYGFPYITTYNNNKKLHIFSYHLPWHIYH